MANGKKTGGRVAGTPNIRTVELKDRLEELGVDPVVGLAQIANDPTASIDLRAKVHCELMTYLYPKRKALDVNSGQTQPITIRIGIPGKSGQDSSGSESLVG